MVGGRVAAGDDCDVRVGDVAVGRRDGAGPDTLEQCCDAGGVTQPRAVVDVVGAEGGADQLLEEVGLLVGALGGTEGGDPVRSALLVDSPQATSHEVERLFPAGLPEVGHHLVVRHEATGLATALALRTVLADVLLHLSRESTLGIGLLDPDQRLGEPLRGGRVVPAVAALHAQPTLAARLVSAVGEGDRAALSIDVEGERATHTAVGTDRVHRVELRARLDRDVVDRLVGQGPGGTGGHALTAGHARGLAHRIIQVEGDPGRVALATATDDVVALHVVACPDAPVAQDARVVVDRDHRVGDVGSAGRPREEVVDVGDGEPVGHREQQVIGCRCLLGVTVARRLVVEQQLGEDLAPALDLRRSGGDLHARLARPDAGGRIGSPTDVDHTHAADAHRVVALIVAEHRDVDPRRAGRLPDGGPFGDRDGLAVDGQGHGALVERRRVGLRHRHRADSVPAAVSTCDGRPSASRPRST